MGKQTELRLRGPSAACFFWVGLGMGRWLAYNYEVVVRGLALIKDSLSAGIKKKHDLRITTVWHESNKLSYVWANCIRNESQPTMYVFGVQG